MSSPKNIVFIISDQQRYDTLGCNGNKLAKTPVLDGLAEKGLNFKNHQVANPVCCPSRGTIFSGKYISNHSLWAMGNRLDEDEETIPKVFNAAGYQTAHFGKMHLIPILDRIGQHPDYGFQTFEVAEGDQQYTSDDAYTNWLRKTAPNDFMAYMGEVFHKGHNDGYASKLKEELHHSTWVTDRAENWLGNERDPSKPFLLSLGYFDPHHAFNPVEPYASMFDDVDFPAPPNDAAYFEGKPTHYKDRLQATKGTMEDPNRIQSVQRAYAAMVAHIDHCIGRVVQQLEAQNLLENTVIVFSTDHGEFLGDHGMLWKGAYLTENLLHVPLIIAGAGITHAEVEALTSSVDFFATLPALAGIENVDPKDGLPMMGTDGSLFPQGAHDALYAEFNDRSWKSPNAVRSVRTERWRLIVYPDQDIVSEFYDLKNDPTEVHNCYLSQDPEIAAARDALEKRFWDEFYIPRPEGEPGAPNW